MQQTQSIKRRIISTMSLLFVLFTLTACGFHLRGNVPLSDGIKNMYVNAPDGEFKELLLERLTNLGVNLVEGPLAGDVILNVTKAQSSRTVGTLDERGKVNSYNMQYRVVYTLLDQAENPIRPKRNLKQSRRYNFDPEFIVESESEEAELVSDMQEEAVLKMIRQLAAITDFDPSAVDVKASEK